MKCMRPMSQWDGGDQVSQHIVTPKTEHKDTCLWGHSETLGTGTKCPNSLRPVLNPTRAHQGHMAGG